MGMAPRCAYAAPVVRFSAPGPSVERQTPGLPVRRPCVAAMNAAACSCRVRTSSIFDVRKDSTKSRFSSPGMPKTRSASSFSSAATKRSDPFAIKHNLLAFARPMEGTGHQTDKWALFPDFERECSLLSSLRRSPRAAEKSAVEGLARGHQGLRRHNAIARPAAGDGGRWNGLARPSPWGCLEDFASLRPAFLGGGGFNEALALTGVQAFAGRRRGLTGALALARIDAAAMDAFGVGGGGDGAGREQCGGDGKDGLLVHDESSRCVYSLCVYRLRIL